MWEEQSANSVRRALNREQPKRRWREREGEETRGWGVGALITSSTHAVLRKEFRAHWVNSHHPGDIRGKQLCDSREH